MYILETPERDIKIEWRIPGRNKQRRHKGKHGAKKCFHATVITIPPELIKLISQDGETTYLYEYFDKVCLLPTPPENQKSLKLKLVSPLNIPSATLEIPSKIFDTTETKTGIITYYPNKRDYSTNKQGLVTLDTQGTDKRKWIKRTLNEEEKTITYQQHVQSDNVPENIYFHKDLTKILDTENIYLYQHEDKFYITDKQPLVECVKTNETEFKEDLFHHNILQITDEIILMKLHITEYDYFNRTQPLIELEILPPQK